MIKIQNVLLLFCALIAARGQSAIVGTNPPSMPLRAERIAGLPTADQPAWKEYLARSEKQMRADKDLLIREKKEHNLKAPINPPGERDAEDLSLKKQPAWYAQPEALRIADIVVSFQTPAGGWSKNLSMSDHVRAPGERFSGDGAPKGQAPSDNDYPPDRNWNYVGTFDNDATVTQLRFLAKVITALDGHNDEKYRRAFLHGVNYIFAAQYPNGGWPQVWPLEGGYHDAITYNDAAMINVMEILNDITEEARDYSFVLQPVRVEAAEHLQHGLKCVVDTQIVANGRRTVWCQQYDPLTLQPCSARNYEMPSQSGGESSRLVEFLMQLPHPSPEIIVTINSAAAWFEKTKITGYKFIRRTDDPHQLVKADDGWPLWPRYSEIGTDRPIFGDRDKTIHDDLSEISKERRNGYSWYSKGPTSMLEKYAAWSSKYSKP